MRLAAAMVAMAVAGPACASVGRLGGGQQLDVSLGRIVIALVIAIIVAVLAILLIRQRSGKIDIAAFFARVELKPRAIQVVETRRLSPHADICLVRHDDREYLLVLLAGRAQVLRDAPRVDAEPVL